MRDLLHQENLISVNEPNLHEQNKYYFMKQIKIPKGEGWKRLESLISYQIDNFRDFEMKEVNYLIEEAEELDGKEKDEKIKMAEETLDYVENFDSLAKRLQEGIDIKVTDSELSVFSECIQRQLEFSKARLEDFREDRFGWGKRTCQKLIDDETIFYNEMNEFLKTLDV